MMEWVLSHSAEIIGFVLGILYLYWEYFNNPRMWFASIGMAIVSFWVYYTAGLYADFAMNIYYFIIAIYGYLAWTFNFSKKKKSALPITHIGLPRAALTAVAFAAVYCALAYWLVNFTDSTVPCWDAFTTAGSIIATWMLARRYVEQWLVWLAVDAVCTGLYWYKDRPFYAILYGIYTVIAVMGYLRWRKEMSR